MKYQLSFLKYKLSFYLFLFIYLFILLFLNVLVMDLMFGLPSYYKDCQPQLSYVIISL